MAGKFPSEAPDVEQGGTQVVAGVRKLNFVGESTVTDQGNREVDVDPMGGGVNYTDIANGDVIASDGNVYSTIQAADDASPDWIIIGAGTFSENVELNTNSVKVIGMGRNTVVDGGTGGEAIQVNNSDQIIRDLAVQTTGGAGNNNDALRVAGTIQSGYIQNVFILDSDRHGINIDGTDITVRDCVAEATDNAGFISDTTSVDNIFDGCRVETNVSGTGVFAEGDNEEVSNCRIDGPGASGIIITGTDSIATYNRVTGAGTNGLDASSATTPTIRGNRVTGSGSSNYVLPSVMARDDHVIRIVDSPNGHIENSILDNDNSAEITVIVPDGQTLKVYRWGAYQVTDGTTPTGLDVELKDGSDTVQATENTQDTESIDPSSPVASHTNSSGSASVFKLAVANDTGASIADPGVGAFFSYLVE